MTHEKKQLIEVESICKDIGYGRVIQVMSARWALDLHKEWALPIRACMTAAFMPNVEQLSAFPDEEILKAIQELAE